MWIAIQNKQLTAYSGKVAITILDDEAKKAHDDKVRPYELTGENTKEAMEQERIRKIITGEGE